VRYLDKVAQRGSNIIVRADDSLHAILRDSYPQFTFMTRKSENFPAFDYYIPLLSLPKVFETTLSSIPNKVPYLNAPKVFFDNLKLPETKNVKVGIVWAGNPNHANDHNRSTELSRFLSLATIPNLTLYSIQKGQQHHLNSLYPKTKVVDLDPYTASFGDTAAVIEQLDLVITVDTSVAHLAGAMGKPVWVLVSYVFDWRWLMDRTDSPWYPSMRLFRQHSDQNWSTVFTDIKQALTEEISKNNKPSAEKAL